MLLYLTLFVIVINVTATTVPFVKRQVHCGGGTHKLGTEQRSTCSEREGQKEYQNQSNTGWARSFLLLVSLGTTSSPSPSCPALFPAFGCVRLSKGPPGYLRVETRESQHFHSLHSAWRPIFCSVNKRSCVLDYSSTLFYSNQTPSQIINGVRQTDQDWLALRWAYLTFYIGSQIGIGVDRQIQKSIVDSRLLKNISKVDCR